MDITQISIHLKDGEEKTHEVSLLQPLEERSLRRGKKPKPSFLWINRLKTKVATIFTPKLTAEAQFKTQLAHLLTQDLVRDHFLDDPQRREAFYLALREAAHHIGYREFAHPAPTLSSMDSAHFLTTLDGFSLIEHPNRLAFHVARMKKEEQPVLDSILSHIERPPLFSGLDIVQNDIETSISLATHYSKFRVLNVEEGGKVSYELFLNKTAPATQSESTINQKVVFDTSNAEDPTWLGSYCGDLGCPNRVLEQILLILQAKGEVQISERPSPLTCKILFTSLYNWRELEEVCRQRDAIRTLDGKTLEIGDERVTLKLYYYNLNSIHRIPIPAETRSFLEDLNDECLIRLLEIEPYSKDLEKLPTDFFERQKIALATVDNFRLKRQEIAATIDDPVFKALILKHRPDGRSLKGMDALLYLEEASKRLRMFHNKNCRNGIDRTSTAKAADKAQNAIRKITGEAYLPGHNDHKQLFKVLYSLYLLWEEPELNAALTIGLFGKSFFRRLFYHNPQQAEYLAKWAELN